MRYLLIFLAVLLLVWRWRSARAAAAIRNPQKPPVVARATTMVACVQCGVHVPSGDAIMGARGAYCCVAHRQQMES